MDWKYLWLILQGWLLIGMLVLGVVVIICGMAFASGQVATLTTLFGVGCIFAAMAGLHG